VTARTFSKTRWLAARAAWRDGEFGPEWKRWRELAAIVAGIIDPPAGSVWDLWTDDDPSQRAIVIRAIRETPELLEAAIRTPGVHAWAAVIAVLLRSRDELAARVEERNRREDEAWERAKAADRASASAALSRLGVGLTPTGGVMSGFVPPSRGNHPERAG